MSLGRLIDTTDRIQANHQTLRSRLHKMLDRVELDRPYLLKDKISLVTSPIKHHTSKIDDDDISEDSVTE